MLYVVTGYEYTCAFYSEKYEAWGVNGVRLSAIENEYIECLTTHLTDFAVLLGYDASSSTQIWNSSDLTIWILSASFIVAMCCCVVVVIFLFSIFPDLRLLVLEGKRPGHAKRLHQRKVAKMKRKTLQALQTDFDEEEPKL